MNVLLDLDGTLTDPFEGITRSIVHALEALGRPAPPRETLAPCIGPPLAETFHGLLDTRDEGLVARAVEAYRERFADVGLFENVLYPEVPAALDALAGEGWTLYVATSKPAVYARRIVAHFGFGGSIRAIHGAELSGVRAQKTELIAHLLATESIAARDAVMVGDRSHDVIGALANGVRAVGVLWGYGSREELAGAGATGLCTRPCKLAGDVASALRTRPPAAA